MPLPLRAIAAAVFCALGLALPASASAQSVPRGVTLDRGWETRVERAGPPDTQLPPPEENAPEGSQPPGPNVPPPRASQLPGPEHWQRTQVPSVFEPRAIASLYPGTVRRYRISFTGPRTPPGWRWMLEFEQVRRAARVYLNGRLIGGNRGPYTPFALEARGLKPRQRNTLLVIVDNRKDGRLPEGWWNWGGIVRPVKLRPVGHAHLSGLGWMSRVRCRGPARGCRAQLLLDGVLERRGGPRIDPRVYVRLRSPTGQLIRKSFRLPKQKASRRRVKLTVPVPGPKLWSPEQPSLYRGRVELRDAGRTQQIERRAVGLRQVAVKRGLLYLNNRRVQLRGASIHEDFPGKGPALTSRDMSRIVAELKELGANVTRAHYLLNDRLLDKLDRAGIMVWNQAPIWQRDHRANLLRYPSQRARAVLTVRRTVRAARSHPSVITHSVANELAFNADRKRETKNFLTTAANWARNLDPTIPISYDIKTRRGMPPQFTYRVFDMIGINQYFGWYSWVQNFDDLEPFLRHMRNIYPKHALVMTEFGSEALPELADAPLERKGGFAFQADHTRRTLEVVDRAPFLSGAIYWTLREFEIYPGWNGGGGRRPDHLEPNTRHHKGLLSYFGRKKPAWHIARAHFTRMPLYHSRRR